MKVDRQPGHGVQVLLPGHVCLDRLHVKAFAPPLRRDDFDFFGLDIADDQPGLLGGKCRDNRFADALGSAGQQYHLVFQALALGRLGHGR
ncbi:hypothetical protein D3C78_1738430 [compost metagenome]